jgi:PilZ domain-containing protein
MGIGVLSQRFCSICGSGHGDLETCPGELRATGAERPGWRVRIETPFGHEEIGVLLAPSHDRWRARIVTFPNMLWSAPGRRGALKFVGDTAEQAEAQAIAFVERHVKAKRYARRELQAPAPFPIVSHAGSSARPAFSVALRKSRCLPVRFSLDRAISRGVTVNLSAEGMFVGVASPVEGGRSLLIHLDLDGHTLPLRGLVMWNRCRAESDGPAGMGIRLSDPTPLYQSFVAGLA